VTADRRGQLVVHAHFYQPLRVDPFSGTVPPDPGAAPFRDWNSRIDAECYRPISTRGTLAHMSYDLGPTLAGWLAAEAPVSHRGFVAADRAAADPVATNSGHGRAMAQPFHHTILPLASAEDRRTEVRWGIRDFEIRYGRRPEGMWLPETAVDTPTLRCLAEEGIRYTILAPWQAAADHLESRRPYRVDIGGGRTMVVAFYDAGLSGAVSFEPAATADADRFARDRAVARLAGTPFPDGDPGLIVIATDGELYGHHQPFRDLFLQRLVEPPEGTADRGFDVANLADVVRDRDPRKLPTVRIAERTSWSCHHGVARWSSECPDAADGHWKQPLRAAFERLAGGVDALVAEASAALPRKPDPMAARDAYLEVVDGVEPAGAFGARWLGDDAAREDRERFLQLMEAQRWRLAMFASDGWYWDDPVRTETKHVLRFAARAARLVDAALGSRLESSLVGDLSLFRSPGTGLDGAAIYRMALSEVGQPGPRA
jgi:hypothetical protein